MLEKRLGREVSGHGDSGAFQQHRHAVWQEVGGLRGEGDGEQLAVAEDLSAHKFLCGGKEHGDVRELCVCVGV